MIFVNRENIPQVLSDNSEIWTRDYLEAIEILRVNPTEENK